MIDCGIILWILDLKRCRMIIFTVIKKHVHDGICSLADEANPISLKAINNRHKLKEDRISYFEDPAMGVNSNNVL